MNKTLEDLGYKCIFKNDYTVIYAEDKKDEKFPYYIQVFVNSEGVVKIAKTKADEKWVKDNTSFPFNEDEYRAVLTILDNIKK